MKHYESEVSQAVLRNICLQEGGLVPEVKRQLLRPGKDKLVEVGVRAGDGLLWTCFVSGRRLGSFIASCSATADRQPLTADEAQS